MHINEASYDSPRLPAPGDTREFEKAILQTAIIYRIAQHRAERDRANGRALASSEDQSAIYKSMLFALIDEWLAGHGDTPPGQAQGAVRAYRSRGRRLRKARAAVLNN